jgi:hypothetical protein
MADNYEGGTLESAAALQDSEVERRGTVELSLTMKGNKLAFDMKCAGGEDLCRTVDGQKCIAIWSNTVVDFVLGGDVDWTVDVSRGILDFKDAANQRWYKVHPKGPDRFTLDARWTGKPIEDPQNHPFNLMVLLNQPDGAKPLPVTIDPDIKNPPPIRP